MRIYRNANKSPRVSISDDIVLFNCFLNVTQYRVSSSWLALELLPARLPCPRPNYLPLIVVPSTSVCTLMCVCVFLCKLSVLVFLSLSALGLVWSAVLSFRRGVFPQEGYQAWRWAGRQWQQAGAVGPEFGLRERGKREKLRERESPASGEEANRWAQPLWGKMSSRSHPLPQLLPVSISWASQGTVGCCVSVCVNVHTPLYLSTALSLIKVANYFSASAEVADVRFFFLFVLFLHVITHCTAP